MYQTLYEEEALEIALRESLDMFHSSREEEDLALALQLSLVNERGQQTDCGESGIPLLLISVMVRFLF
jgi:hypothetical protein